jgi:hypothetical protein
MPRRTSSTGGRALATLVLAAVAVLVLALAQPTAAARPAPSSSGSTFSFAAGARRKLMQWGRWGGGWGGGWGYGGGYPWGNAYAGEFFFKVVLARVFFRATAAAAYRRLGCCAVLPGLPLFLKPPPRSSHTNHPNNKQTGPWGSCATGVGGYACNLGGSGRSSASAVSGGSALAVASTPKANAVAGGGK